MFTWKTQQTQVQSNTQMMKLKPKAPIVAVPSKNIGKGNSPGTRAVLRRHAFKPGQSGNPSGRPKIMYEESTAYLRETGEEGKTNARRIVENMGEIAKSKDKNSVNACKALKEMSDPIDPGQPMGDVSDFHIRIYAAFNRLALEKNADVIDI